MRNTTRRGAVVLVTLAAAATFLGAYLGERVLGEPEGEGAPGSGQTDAAWR